MAKSVLISIRPQWVEKIFNGSKTIEVRRTFPKQLETPFKALVYCTKAKHIPEDGLYFLPNDKQLYLGCKKKDLGFVCWEGDFRNGKVIGSFVCDRVRLCIPFGLKGHLLSQEVYREMCLTKEQLDKYGGLKTLYGWYITSPKLFDKPRELSEFGIARPPQSWCYVEQAP